MLQRLISSWPKPLFYLLLLVLALSVAASAQQTYAPDARAPLYGQPLKQQAQPGWVEGQPGPYRHGQAPQGQPGFTLPPGQAAPGGQPYPATVAPQSPWNGQGAIVVPPISFIDINSGRFGKLEVDLEDGYFLDAAVDRLHLLARNLDLSQGSLASLSVSIQGGHLEDFIFDSLTLDTQGALTFDTGVLINHKTLQFTAPALAQVQAVVSQPSLNRFLNSPRTLSRLSVAAVRKASVLEALIGPTGGLVSFTGANVTLQPDNRVLLALETKLGLGEIAIPVPLELNTQLALRNGWVYLTDSRLSTQGQEISPQISQLILNKVNSLAEWGQRSDDIQFNFTDLKVIPGNRFVLTGTAAVRRLRLARDRA